MSDFESFSPEVDDGVLHERTKMASSNKATSGILILLIEFIILEVFLRLIKVLYNDSACTTAAIANTCHSYLLAFLFQRAE